MAMSTIAPTPRTSRPSPTDVRARFRLEPVPGFVAGGWWPRSLDLAAEVPDLVRAARAAGLPAFRVMYSLDAWTRPPHALLVDGAVVKLGGYRTVDPSIVTLVDPSGWERADVVVIPPDTEATFAASALSSASADDNHAALEILEHRTTTEES